MPSTTLSNTFSANTKIKSANVNQNFTDNRTCIGFRVWRNAALNTAAGAFTIVAFDTESFDIGDNFNLGNSQFVVPVYGFYQFNARINVTAATSVISVALFVNGAQRSTGGTIVNNSTHGVNLSDLLELNTDDVVETRVYSTGAVAFETGSSYLQFFSGFFQGI